MIDASTNDILRLGVYSQMEGQVFYHPKHKFYRFRLFTNQIEDVKELAERVLGRTVNQSGPHIQFKSKELHDALTKLGFYKFHTYDWNVPNVINRSQEYRKEYLRAAIDSLGDVDVEESVPVCRIRSANHESLARLAKTYDGKFFTYKDGKYSRSVVVWKGKDAMDLIRWLDYKFYCPSNMRGAELVRIVKWEVF